MRLILIVTAFIASTMPAFADATLTCAITGAGGANATSSMVISDADGARFIAWAKTRVAGNATNAQAVKASLDSLLESIRTGVYDHERNSVSVAPITPK